MISRIRLVGLLAASMLVMLYQPPGVGSARRVALSAGATAPISQTSEALAACVAKADYRFQNTLNTSVGSAPALSNLGAGNAFVNATVDGANRTVVRFPLNSGLVLDPTSSVVSAQVYTIVVLFSLDEVSGFRRILDFKHGTVDDGLYVFDGKLAFFPRSDGLNTAIAANTYVQVVLTRDAGKNFTGYVNGVQVLSFVDTADLAVLDSFNQLRFFRDNESNGPGDESSAGSVARIRLYDCAFSAAEVIGLDRLPAGAGCPVVNNFNPTIATVGSAVTISGSSVTGVTAVKFASGVNANFTIPNDTLITTSVPAGAVNGPITLIKAGCSDTVTANFTVARPMTCVSAASFQIGNLASESIIACFGNGIATGTASAATVPLPTTLAGTTITVRDAASTDRASGILFVNSTQLNGQIPQGTVNGTATVTVTSSDGIVSRGQVLITNVAPGIFTANASGIGVPSAYLIRVKPGNVQTQEELLEFSDAQNRFVPKPIDLGPPADQLFLVLFGTGWRFRSALGGVSLGIGGVNSTVAFAGDQGFLAGLDQVNALLPRALIGRGEVNVNLMVDGAAANIVMLTFN
ncbi:MAG: LamG-like jellyroll fold domain-containing protein [Acidobacteriota bacterium]